MQGFTKYKEISETKFDKVKILEIGGGNSCFAKEICDANKVDTYDILDNCELATSLFEQMDLVVDNKKVLLQDLLDNTAELSDEYDFVYSVGVIEHFLGKNVETVINKHFDRCKVGGVVLITFPTPSFKYVFVRRIMEILGVWCFTDETPLLYESVKGFFENRGVVTRHFLNNKIPLTQYVVVARRRL